MTKNATGADNQQERLVRIGWIVGFVDGEGCFSIGFVKQPAKREDTRLRQGYRLSYQVVHEFVVTQGAKSKFALVSLQRFFGVGQVVVNRRHDNHSEDMYRYVVRKRADLLTVIIPFFQRYTLQTSKHHDFQKFVTCVESINSGSHLTSTGLIQIAEISQTMNRRKSREELIRILRDYTPDPLTT